MKHCNLPLQLWIYVDPVAKNCVFSSGKAKHKCKIVDSLVIIPQSSRVHFSWDLNWWAKNYFHLVRVVLRYLLDQASSARCIGALVQPLKQPEVQGRVIRNLRMVSKAGWRACDRGNGSRIRILCYVLWFEDVYHVMRISCGMASFERKMLILTWLSADLCMHGCWQK